MPAAVLGAVTKIVGAGMCCAGAGAAASAGAGANACAISGARAGSAPARRPHLAETLVDLAVQKPGGTSVRMLTSSSGGGVVSKVGCFTRLGEATSPSWASRAAQVNGGAAAALGDPF